MRTSLFVEDNLSTFGHHKEMVRRIKALSSKK